jgi:Flp pilus assembly protein CpaB
LLARRPLAYWSVTLAVGAVAATLVHGVVTTAEAARHQWGTLRPAVVATAAVTPGGVLDATNTAVRSLPAALVPATALRALPAGSVASGPLAAGEVLVPERLGRAGRSPVRALLADGTRGVAVPAPAAAGLSLRVGDVVDIVGPALDVGGGTIVEVTDATAVVAVPARDAAAVARAVAAGSVSLMLDP